MSRKIDKLTKEELEDIIHLKIEPKIRAVESTGIIDKIYKYILIFIKNLKKLNITDIYNDPKKFIRDLADVFQVDEKTFKNILYNMIIVLGLIQAVKSFKENTKNIETLKRVRIVRLFFYLNACQLVTTIYLSVIESYVVKIHPEVIDAVIELNARRIQRYKKIIELIKNNQYIEAIKLICKSFILTEVDIFKWQWDLGKYDPFKLYRPCFILDWVSAIAIIIVSPYLSYATYKGLRKEATLQEAEDGLLDIVFTK